MSHPFRALPLPEAVRVIQERLWPDLERSRQVAAMAREMDVSTRVVYCWLSGKTGMTYKNTGKLRPLARRANVSVTAESLVIRSHRRTKK